ncbi:hypothetical protein OHT20_04675 [Streptomyces caniferus]|uniref:Uncharacterized protein n=1 Tax=Streptomyces caniferus TaxID=285557 RepID=A0A640S5Z6_9ACTN|nr:hypothetical protein [Streptomyces caniferus]GFE06447.1 hypothetical protein Scani_27150 [Streptomyces caniferus]
MAVVVTGTVATAVVAVADDRPRTHQDVVLVFEKVAVVDVCRREHGAGSEATRSDPSAG